MTFILFEEKKKGAEKKHTQFIWVVELNKYGRYKLTNKKKKNDAEKRYELYWL